MVCIKTIIAEWNVEFTTMLEGQNASDVEHQEDMVGNFTEIIW